MDSKSGADRAPQLQDWLPTSRKEMELRGWDCADVIIFSGDAYVDHPSFAAAVVGRTLESQGLRVAVVPQPNWRDDLRDFRKLGRPRLFFAVSAGAMDSMVNHYTANKRLRSDDAYTPDGRAGMRPDMPSIVYTDILKRLYPDVPVVLGGIEASLRRLSHYDYWKDRLLPGMLVQSRADILIYGMGELPLKELVRRLNDGERIPDIKDMPQTAVRMTVADLPQSPNPDRDIVLASYEDCLRDPSLQAANFRHIEEESNRIYAASLWQAAGPDGEVTLVNPPFKPMTEAEIDESFDLPYTRLPHPRYRGKTIPAYEMIKFSINLHRGCFGGCAFCTISAHQGKFIASRSKESVLREVRKVAALPGFKGYLSDLGGPSANMYRMHGRDLRLCARCRKPSCLHPAVCPNLDTDHSALLDIYRAVDALPEIKKSFIGSGVRYDLMLHRSKSDEVNRVNRIYAEELIARHVSGRLKVAPEHTAAATLRVMRKPPFELFGEFKKIFDEVNARYHLNQQLIPYFISSHPGCTPESMAELAVATKDMDFKLEQVQDFTPTPMTVSSEIYYSGIHPYTGEKIFTARTRDEKLGQRQFFFWYKPECRQSITAALLAMGRRDLLARLYPSNPSTAARRSHPGSKPPAGNRRKPDKRRK